MTQTWQIPAGSDVMADAVKTSIPNSLNALRSLFSGSSAPTNTTPYQLWADTTNGRLRQRNAADTDWIDVAPLEYDIAKRTVLVGRFESLSATKTVHLPICDRAAKIARIYLVADTTTSSSSGNEWQFALQNKTAAVALFSATVGTFTSLGGVGGGAEVTTDVAFVLVPDQNDTIAASDVLEFTATVAGTVTTLGRVSIFVEFSPTT